MDHSDVARLQAVEKYVLGELPANLRDEFEEHYFDCSECADDVKRLATFVTASRAILKEGEFAKAVTPSQRETERRGWFAWLPPAIAVPAVAALAAIIAFQNLVTIPALKQGGSVGRAQVFGTSYHLQGATRGDNLSKITVRPDESFALDFDFTPAMTFQSYAGRLVDQSSNEVASFRLSSEMVNKEVHLVIAAGKVRAGNYDLVFVGEGGSSQGGQSREVQRISFVVESLP